MNADRIRLSYVTTVAIGAGTAVFFFWWWWWSRRPKYQLPSKWRKVGELDDLVAYPVKSLGPIRFNKMECTLLGLKSGWLRDRTLMVVDLKGHAVTARQYPKMVQVSPSISDSTLTISAPGMMSVSIDLARLRGKCFYATVWNQKVKARDCGEEVAKWLSRYLVQEDVGFRLIYYPLEGPTRQLRPNDKGFPLLLKSDTGAYPDETSYNMINEASVADLNARLKDSVTPANFRPNFVVKGATAYDEDNWDWIKIGDVIFRNIRPCTRCVFTTIDPETAVKHPDVEPLKTLKSYRQITDPEIRPFTGESPAMGIHLGLKGPNGIVKLGDPIYVGVTEEAPQTPVASPP